MYKTLFIHPVDDFTGSTRVLANVIESNYANDEVWIVTRPSSGFLSELTNVKILPVAYPTFRERKCFLSPLISRISAFILVLIYGVRFDVFHINTIVPFYAAIIGKLYRKKIIYHIHEKFISRTFDKRIYAWFFNRTRAKRIYVSEYLKKQYEDRSDCESVVEYNVLAKSFWDKVSVVPIEERYLNTIIMIASLSKAKGVFTYVDVARKMPNYRFVLILGANNEKIDSFFAERLPDNLTVYPSQRDIRPFLQKSDLMMNLSVLSLWMETFGMTILEAMAYGIPSIVPNVGGPTELVINDFNGYCVDVTNVDLLMNTISRVLEQNNYKRLSINAIDRFKSKFLI